MKTSAICGGPGADARVFSRVPLRPVRLRCQRRLPAAHTLPAERRRSYWQPFAQPGFRDPLHCCRQACRRACSCCCCCCCCCCRCRCSCCCRSIACCCCLACDWAC